MPATKLIAVNASSAGGHLPLPSVLSAAIRCADLTCAIKLLLRGASPVGCTPRTPASRGEWGAALSQSCAESAPASPQGSSAPHQPSFAGPRANQATRTRGARRRSLTPIVLVPRLAQPHHGCAVPQARPTASKVTTACLEPTTNRRGGRRPAVIKPARACAEQPHRGQCRRGGNLMARTRTRLTAPFTLHRGIGIPSQSMRSRKAHDGAAAFLMNSS